MIIYSEKGDINQLLRILISVKQPEECYTVQFLLDYDSNRSWECIMMLSVH